MMKRASLLFLLSVFLIAAPTIARAQADQRFYLSLRLNDPYNPDLLVRIPVRINKPFKAVIENDVVKTTISGMVRSPEKDKYPLTLNVSEWVSEQSNIGESSERELKLDRAQGFGPISSFVYLRKVLLSNTMPPIED